MPDTPFDYQREDLIAQQAERTDSIAIISDDGQWTYRDLHVLIQNSCSQLAGSTHSFYPFICEKNLESIALFFSFLRLKKIAFPLNAKLPEHQIKDILQKIEDHDSVHEKQLATFLLTSGSSGKPKIACHSLGNHYFSAMGSNSVIPLSPNDRWLLTLPLYHVGGLQILFRSFVASSAVVISNKPMIETLLNKKITHLSLVPTQLYRLLNEDHSVLKRLSSQLKCILLGGGPISAELYKKAIELGLRVCPSYGLTEMTSQVCTDSSQSPYLSCGRPLPFREVKVSEDGEILVKGETLFQGYVENSTPLLNLNDGWFATGDLGSFGADGTLHFLGRKDHLFISGGENIQPEEIEEHLLRFPGIVQAIVVPLNDEEFGARPVAFVLNEEKSFCPDAIRDFLKVYLPSYKVPIRFYPLNCEDRLKPDRSTLRALAAAFEEQKQVPSA